MDSKNIYYERLQWPFTRQKTCWHLLLDYYGGFEGLSRKIEIIA